VAAIRAAQLGAQVTLVDHNILGGTCLNVGCIPTKSLLHCAEIFDEAKHAGEYGLNIDVKGYDWQKVQSKKNQTVKQLVDGVTGLMRANKISVIKATAKFETQNSLLLTKQDGSAQIVQADKIIIAVGSRPEIPNISGLEGNPLCIDSTGALSLEEVPKEMLVIGGGVVAVELATIYSVFGCKVTMLKRSPIILPSMDQELVDILVKSLAQRKIDIITGVKFLSAQNENARIKLNVEIAGQKKTFEAQKILVAAGRRINTENLGLEKIGIACGKNGEILTDDKMQTNIKNIYAIGDCLGKVMLAHTASAQGEVAAENACGHNLIYDGRTSPICVYTLPEFAGVGATEDELKSKNIDYLVGKFPLYANGKALIANGGEGMIKILLGKKYNEVLGVHIIGPRATDMIACGALMIGFEATIDDVCACIYAHPTVSEAIREAFLAAKSRAIHIPNK
jgi:dihydrolipoamide dehydrogenase